MNVILNGRNFCIFRGESSEGITLEMK